MGLSVTKITGMYNKPNTMCIYIKKNDLLVSKENSLSHLL